MTETLETQETWYEVSMGWYPTRSWFEVSVPEEELHHHGICVQVKHVDGDIAEIGVLALFPNRPTLKDVLTLVLDETHCDHACVAKYQLTDRMAGTAPEWVV